MEEKTIICSESKSMMKALVIMSVSLIEIVYLSFAALWGQDVEESLYIQLLFIDLPIIVFFCFVLHAYSSCEIVVTDKRVYGKAVFGKRVDLPIDSVSAVGTSMFKGIDVGTSSGRIKFKFVENNEKIHDELSKLLMERQSAGKAAPAPVSEPTSGMDDLKKLKELLDSGIITQEEFDAKKKQILGL